MTNFFVSSPEEIKTGQTTDIYFKRTEEILKKKGIIKIVVAEFTASSLPDNYPWAVFAGLEESLKLLEGVPVDLYSLDEGTVFYNQDKRGVFIPVMFIEGDYKEFAIYETPILGFICQSTGIATKAARIKKLAGQDALVLSFGIRRMHPAIAPMIDRNAYIGGCDGVSSIIGARTIGKKPMGTMPHALIITMGEREAWLAFHEEMPEDIPRIALIDTYGDEKVKAVEACETMPNIFGVRLDTPSSRRGDFVKIVSETRWELDIRGYKDVKIFVSGGIKEKDIRALKEAGVYGFGVGTSISNAPTIDFAMDIVEIEGRPVAKKGKFGGKKQVLRCNNCLKLKVVEWGKEIHVKCENCGNEMETALKKYLEKGKIIRDLPSPDEIRKYVLSQILRLGDLEP